MSQTKRQLQKEITRRKIIETAYQVFAKKGFSATTSLIAKEANVAHGTIFVHFTTLDDLLVCLLQEFGNAIGKNLHTLSERSNSLEDVLETHISVLEEYEDFYGRLITEANLIPYEAKNIFASIQSTTAFHFSIVFEREISVGKIKSIPVYMLFNTWIGLLHYYLQNKDFFAPDSSVFQRYRQDLIGTFLKLTKQ